MRLGHSLLLSYSDWCIPQNEKPPGRHIVPRRLVLSEISTVPLKVHILRQQELKGLNVFTPFGRWLSKETCRNCFSERWGRTATRGP
jgi:hypothetical protein